MSSSTNADKTGKLLKSGLSDLQFALFVTVAFACFTFIVLLHHEMWRDEFQAWQVARFSPDLKTFYENQRIESGHLILWNIILYIISHFLGCIHWEQAVHVLISCSSVFVLSRYAPFPRLYKVLIPFGYFFFYEYSIIAREYSLTVLLVMIILYTMQKLPNKIVLLGVLLALLIQINYYSIVFAVGFSLLSLKALFAERKKGAFTTKIKMNIFLSTLIVAISSVFALMQIFHGYNDRVTKQLSGNARFFNDHVSDTLTRALSAFLPVPFFDSVNVWNHFIIEYFSTGLRLFLFAIILLSILWLFRKRKDIVLFFILCGGVFVAFAYQSIYGYARHQGHIYILFIAALWMYYARKSEHANKESLLNKAAGSVVVFVLTIQVITSTIFVYKDVKYPFSNIPAMADYVESNNLTRLNICGYFDYSTSPLSAYTYRPVYFPQSKSNAYFIDWSKSKPNLTNKEIMADIAGQLRSDSSLI